jgi:DNA-3-methyladenine glycosylase II
MAANNSRPQGFETLVLLILEQQVSIDSAKALLKIWKGYMSLNHV